MLFAERIPVTTHGRYLVHATSSAAPLLLAGFHGYAEAAEAQLGRMKTIPGSESCVIVSIQGLHRFYRGRSQDVVASWMTRQEREFAIADNLAYVEAVIASVVARFTPGDRRVFTGFSQGVAMAFRAACASPRPCGVVALGGDIPPELDAAALSRLPGVLIGRGERDPWYSPATADEDVARLREADVPVTSVPLDAAHEWTEEFSRASGEFIASFAAPLPSSC
jgi:predicted esterase